MNNSNDNWGEWVFYPKGSESPIPAPKPPTNEELIESILCRVGDKDFFVEIVLWLRRDAPKKLRNVLADLQNWSPNYESLCETVYTLGFRAPPSLETRMVLGSPNPWVKKYFEDFPPGSRE